MLISYNLSIFKLYVNFKLHIIRNSFVNFFLGSVLQYARDCLTTIVFTSIEFNICLMYDTLNGLHSVWKIRKPTAEVIYIIKLFIHINFSIFYL